MPVYLFEEVVWLGKIADRLAQLVLKEVEVRRGRSKVERLAQLASAFLD